MNKAWLLIIALLVLGIMQFSSIQLITPDVFEEYKAEYGKSYFREGE